MAELLFTQYNPRSLLQAIFIDPEKMLVEDSLWLCAWCYKCFNRCPQGLKPPEIFQLLKTKAVKRGLFKGFKEAVKKIRNSIPLPVICLYTCFHPERAEMDSKLFAEALEELNTRRKLKKRKKTAIHKEKVAVIGSGPAGLTAAFDLAEMGYPVTMFEALNEAGGMLRKGMPEYRLPRKALRDEIRYLKTLGVKIKTKTRVGKDVSFNDLWRNEFKALFIAVGAHKSRELGIEGEGLEGVVDALDFLWKVNMKREVNLGYKVGVVGGGNVAIDAARIALHQGAKEVMILYRRSREEMPANPWEIIEAEKEGVSIEFLVVPKKIMGQKGRITGVECFKTQLGEPDETGRRRPIPVPGSEFFLEFDTIIVAIGEIAETTFLPAEVETYKGKILVDPINMKTSMKGVFAGGDAVTGPATVIEAILAGKKAAFSIDQYLTETKNREDTAW
ncbi:MAG: FAD-dependent oxidoreductase [Candidatus Bathyarchaeota archaeon]|nr:MAG: FAD-dependent oxidoreductase [Candidatus Bathyarchaeota archaeon]